MNPRQMFKRYEHLDLQPLPLLRTLPFLALMSLYGRASLRDLLFLLVSRVAHVNVISAISPKVTNAKPR